MTNTLTATSAVLHVQSEFYDLDNDRQVVARTPSLTEVAATLATLDLIADAGVELVRRVGQAFRNQAGDPARRERYIEAPFGLGPRFEGTPWRGGDVEPVRVLYHNPLEVWLSLLGSGGVIGGMVVVAKFARDFGAARRQGSARARAVEAQANDLENLMRLRGALIDRVVTEIEKAHRLEDQRPVATAAVDALSIERLLNLLKLTDAIRAVELVTAAEVPRD